MTEDDADPEFVSDGARAQPGAAALALDAVLELLADQRRRLALYTLMAAGDGVVAIDDLTEAVATLEAAIEGGAFTSDRYLAVATDLYYWHLPVLAEAGIVEWDERSNAVRYWGEPTLETWSRRLERDELDRE